MKDLDRTAVARRIAGLSEEKAAKVLEFMEEIEAKQAGNTKNSFYGNRKGGRGMRKIALQGLIGRKRDTILLWTVIVLAFLFLALPTTLITSLNATDAAQRKNTYGKWQILASELDGEAAAELTGLADASAVTPVLEASGTDYFQGDNTYTLGVYSPELADLGSFQLREGRWPEAADEIVLEYARLAALGLEVGDTFSVQYAMELPMGEEKAKDNLAAEQAVFAAVREETYNAEWESCMYIFRSGDWEVYNEFNDLYDPSTGRLTEYMPVLRFWDETYSMTITITAQGTLYNWRYFTPGDGVAFFLWWWQNCSNTEIFIDEAHPEGLYCPLSVITEEQFATALDYFLNTVYIPYIFSEVEFDVSRTVDLLGIEGVSARVDFTDGEGVTAPMDLKLTGQYTVCGVIDTYTDHWDNGRVNLPGGFLSEAGYTRLQEAKQTALDKYPFFADVEDSHIALLQDAGEVSGLWREIVPTYNRIMREKVDFTTPIGFTWLAGAEIDVDPETGYYMGLLGYEDEFYQVQFPLYLADSDHPMSDEISYVDAWLVMESPDASYYNDHLLTEAEGLLCYDAVQGSFDQLAEDEEGRFTLSQTYTYTNGYKAGGLVPQEYSYTRDMAFSGDLDTATVAMELDGQRYDIPLAEFIAGDFTVNGLVPLGEHAAALDCMDLQTDYDTLRVNTLAYPSSAEGIGTMLVLVMGMLFVTTVCAVFQICFTQIRRRMRRIVLMKSLGAETKQIAGMMVWEFLYFWMTSLPVGTAVGLGSAWAATAILSHTQGREVLLTVEPWVLLLALLAGTLALAIGMMIPAVMAVGVPLTGRTVRRKALAPPKKDTKQDFFHVTLRGLTAKKGRTVGSFALCAFIMTITVLCLFLGFRFLGEYRDTVIRDGKPDYLLRSPYAMSIRQREEYLAELEELGVCGEITSYFVGEDIGLDGSGLEESVLFRIAAGDGTSCLVNLYTLNSEDALFSDLQDAATVGRLDKTAFDNGTEVLLAIPLYRDTGIINETALESAEGWDRLSAAGVETSFLAEYDGVFQRDEAVQVGDTLLLENTSVSIRNESYATSEQALEVTVGAILYYFPDTGIWPLSGSGEGYQIVASPSLLAKLLPDAGSTRDSLSVRAIYLQQNALSAMDGVYGATDFYITAAGDVDKDEADTALLVFARGHYMDIEVYHEGSTMLLRNAVSNILLACLLGMSAVLLALVIFYNTVSSDIQQERPRIGILQSLGVSSRMFTTRQAAIGAVASGIAVVVANILLWGGVILFVCATGTVLGNLLWGYPTAWHVCLCAALACVLIFLFVLPMRGVVRYLPIENIRSKN